MKVSSLLLLAAFSLQSLSLTAQVLPKEEILALTAEWKGERFPDGRPKVPDSILERMKSVSVEEAWGTLRGEGYNNQFEGGWKMINDKVVTGRALTAQYMPKRPDMDNKINLQGQKEKRVGGQNSWPIDMLTKGDIYVADGFGKIEGGTLIGDNLGNAIFAKSGTGVVFNGSARDLNGLSQIEGFNAWVRDWHPSYIMEMTMAGMNVPIRIGQTTVLPGDVVLARREGVVFVPAHLAEKVVQRSEIVRLRDQFGITRLKEGKYTPGEIDRKWSEAIEKDFAAWLKTNKKSLPVPEAQVEELLRTRSW
jgi:4-hydroxy-4-methyl-2-oxoglutarate aldolase